MSYDPAILESQVVNLTSDLANKATDTSVVHLAGTETISGAKSFTATNTVFTSLTVSGSTIYRPASSNRWGHGLDGATETGFNNGSNWALQAYDDSGSPLGAYVTVNRATGNLALATGATITAVGTGLTGVPKAGITGLTPDGAGVCDGRLTLSSTLPVTVADVTTPATTGTIYLLPFNGNQISIYNGTSWAVMTFTSTSIAPGTSNGVYDLFAYNNSGTVNLIGIAWTSTTVRATALATQDGVLVASSNHGYRYMGTYMIAGSTVSDTALVRGLWNYYNRRRRKLKVIETTANWTYGTSTWRVANNNSANIVTVVIGWQDSWVDLKVSTFSTPDATNLQIASQGIGYDSLTATPVSDLAGRFGFQSMQNSGAASLIHLPAVGQHFYSWMELVETNAGALTIYGVLSSGRVQSGIIGTIEN